jgi:hypothetical protein
MSDESLKMIIIKIKKRRKYYFTYKNMYIPYNSINHTGDISQSNYGRKRRS